MKNPRQPVSRLVPPEESVEDMVVKEVLVVAEAVAEMEPTDQFVDRLSVKGASVQQRVHESRGKAAVATAVALFCVCYMHQFACSPQRTTLI